MIYELHAPARAYHTGWGRLFHERIMMSDTTVMDPRVEAMIAAAPQHIQMMLESQRQAVEAIKGNTPRPSKSALVKWPQGRYTIVGQHNMFLRGWVSLWRADTIEEAGESMLRLWGSDCHRLELHRDGQVDDEATRLAYESAEGLMRKEEPDLSLFPGAMFWALISKSNRRDYSEKTPRRKMMWTNGG